MAKLRIKLAHEREVIRLRAAKTQHRIRIADAKDAIRTIDSKLQGMRTKKPNTTDVTS